MLPEVGQVVAVVEGQLLARGDVASSHNPYPFLDQFRVAIRRAAVIEDAGGILGNIPVEVPILVQVEDKLIPCFAAMDGFCLVDALSDILDHSATFDEVDGRESARPVNAGWSESHSCDRCRHAWILINGRVPINAGGSGARAIAAGFGARNVLRWPTGDKR